MYDKNKISQIEESVKKLAKLPLHHVPGEAFVYSEGLDVAGYLIEIINPDLVGVLVGINFFVPGVAVGLPHSRDPSANPGLSEP